MSIDDLKESALKAEELFGIEECERFAEELRRRGISAISILQSEEDARRKVRNESESAAL